MSKIHFVGGEKGGVGKSVFSRVLSQYFLDKALFYRGLDADQSHPTLTRYYPEYTAPLNLDVFDSIDQIMELAASGDQQVLVDLPAQSQRFLDRWIEANGVLELCAELNIPVTYWYVVDDGRDSVQLLARFIEKYQNHINCVVVKNKGCGTDFSEIESLLAQVENSGSMNSIKQLFLPELHKPTLHTIDRLSFSFWAAANIKDSDVGHLSMMERQRARVWVKNVYAAIDAVS